jgi:coenzyme F420-dependent glucose-6-phosphate dehydrogenase
MAQKRFVLSVSQEQFPPEALLAQAVAAERAGFDGVGTSDHLQPWWEGGESGHAWPWLGAAGQLTSKVALGTGVTTPGARYHPGMIAQAWATLERMYPGRMWLGFGSGEALNEVPVGDDWPPPAKQVERMEEALEIINGLWDGETVTQEGFFGCRDLRLWTLPERRPPIYVSAFGPKAAAVAARQGDGIWTLGDPEQAPEVIGAYRAECDRIGSEPGEIVLQALFSWADDDETALEAARPWKGAQPQEFYTENWHTPAEMYAHAEAQISDEDLKRSLIIGSDPELHVERIRQMVDLGATIVSLQNASGAAPVRAVEVYGESVLPALRGAGVRE